MNIRSISKFRLELHQIYVFDVQRFPVARNHHDNGQAHGGFGRGHDNHKENKNQAVKLIEFAAEGDECKVDGVEHQLDGHENRDDVALEHKSDDAQAEKHGAQNQVIGNWDHR